MAGAQFEYDEQGSTFLYVIISFYLFILFPITYFAWPGKKKAGRDIDRAQCQCDGCVHKRVNKKSQEPWAATKRWSRYTIVIVAWLGFFLLAYRISHLESHHVEYDPFAILELDPGATVAEVKKAYRELSKKYHPDRPDGDEKKLVAISKAHAALTDDESRENWEKYGNPDGPGATTFGIALPKWIVSKEYGIWVLAIYGLVFMIVLPSAVGIWWYNSIKYSADQVLRDTSQLFLSLFYKTQNMMVKRAITVMSGAFEFSRIYNKDVVERPSDDREVPQLMKSLPTKFGESKQEKPLCYHYAVKARALMHAHLHRIPLPADTLDIDRAFMLHKVPLLVQEMIQVFAQLVMFASTGRINRMPALETLENVMRLMPMFVQAQWDSRSPLLQLPHFTEEMLRYCITKKRRIRTIANLAEMPDEDRRMLLRALSADQYRDMMIVLRSMPRVEVTWKLEVTGEDDKEHISAGSLVTVKCTLIRHPMMDHDIDTIKPGTSMQQVDEMDDDDDANSVAASTNQGDDNQDDEQALLDTKQKSKKDEPSQRSDREDNGSDDDQMSASDSEIDDLKDAADEANEPESEDEETLAFDDELMKKERILETKSKITHPVHCPFWPEDKYEWWWVYLCDRKRKLLVSAPQSVTSLVDQTEVELRFPAPQVKGTYTYQICVRSDSYVDADARIDMTFNVHEARQVTSHPQWDFNTDDEMDKNHDSDEQSDVDVDYTEGEEEDDE